MRRDAPTRAHASLRAHAGSAHASRWSPARRNAPGSSSRCGEHARDTTAGSEPGSATRSAPSSARPRRASANATSPATYTPVKSAEVESFFAGGMGARSLGNQILIYNQTVSELPEHPCSRRLEL